MVPLSLTYSDIRKIQYALSVYAYVYMQNYVMSWLSIMYKTCMNMYVGDMGHMA